ncbi:MAG: 16S rRNA (cytidine(1402)-2'-O)-methyltransferase [Candidatus Taylorbacteria bacterium CG10_big_fil_rev_8_21_14_0_10_41_48]|uniref:Ribosomal RNA small subunit methyltransferase I n=1 Tax=Candidatus Taylorbacteria bacterium CG10_big_fil_rev_8_21_14_0_10_41_48 TaxID=1975024 RepID=A0A2M8LB56_9BACT|nr:MAG: 16S rRNA (cytidine(1402)-2'-O)-methyltransferase [Candidatus Taylorbacteria bacterium CG10_big_fil_rev_8_21_14_0_10_41_48]
MATLYIVATPIGNLEDMTLRAIRVLKEVSVVFCEDTRTSAKLFSQYEIGTPRESFHAQSPLSRIDRIIGLLEDGNDVALITDAGTPGVSDPGSLLVSEVRMRTDANISPIPGASALTAALSIAGVGLSDFVFLGFLPHKKGRSTLFREMAESKRAYVFYESPHRIMKTLESLKGLENKKVTILRELTKIFEERVSGTPAEVLTYFTEHTDKVRGEFVVIVS